MQRRWGRPVVRFKRATADSHGEVQGSRNDMKMSNVPAAFHVPAKMFSNLAREVAGEGPGQWFNVQPSFNHPG